MDVEKWLFEKAREDDKDVQLSHLYTTEFMFGGRWVMDLLEEYAQLYHEQELSKLHQPTVSGRSEQLSDSLKDQIKRGELDPYSPHAEWVKP